ncbi:hypothetical protein EG328_003704 [Venturia inaequalis]|uniref:Peroxidase n=1 Tax=Venturia inaequalis TaxID=5025 RepID=A0A8H3USG9_VENIN|nr:hypothetical protein EG328_003704 [Venturia inaequalis]
MAAVIDHVLAYPGMAAKLNEVSKLIKRNNPVGTNVLLGDLAKGHTTVAGTTIFDCLADKIDCYDTTVKTYVAPPLFSSACAADKCCIWDWIQKDLVADFLDPTDQTCTALARAAIRLGFHDAGPWKQGNKFGGADGSIILNPEEMTRAENNGLQSIVAYTKKTMSKYPTAGVADLVQFMAKIATVTCPLGVRMRTFIGRPDSTLANPEGLMPDIHQDTQSLVDMFNAKTIGPDGLVALIGAHTTAVQQFAIPNNPGSLDPTPGVWDVTFYNHTVDLSTFHIGNRRFPRLPPRPKYMGQLLR